jgi:hypothetical protein
MRRTSTFLAVGMVTLVAVAAPASLASADDQHGNKGAVWSLDQPMHGYDSGTMWGPAISEWAQGKETGQGTMPGVSDGVHEAKGNGPKGK